MTGPQHYTEAERLLRKAADYTGKPASAEIHLSQLAQVHATLALAAFTAVIAGIEPTR